MPPIPTEAKPLFRAEALRPRLATFAISPAAVAARAKLANWAQLLASKQTEGMKETELLPGFLSDVFGSLLGYTGPADGGPTYTLKREATIEVDGKFADASLGRFSTAGGEPHYVAALEGKGPRDPLDRPFGGRKLSAVNQALHYAVNLCCDWYLVTNLKELRLYHKGHDQFTFERFDTPALADDEAAFRRFLFLLGAERFVPPSGHCHLDDLLADSHRIGQELTRAYYREYAELRRRTFEALGRHNADIPPAELLTATQKLLDRVLFIAFCEDRGLLPSGIVARAYSHADPFNPRPIWENFRGLFRAVNEGNAGLGVERYNGGLFAADPVLDRLQVPDEVCQGLNRLAAYEYRAPTPADGEPSAAGAAKLIDVEILGHILRAIHQRPGRVAADHRGRPGGRGRENGAVEAEKGGRLLYAAVRDSLHRRRDAAADPHRALRGDPPGAGRAGRLDRAQGAQGSERL